MFMGRALYRKHRPRKLSEVVGQDHITTTLQNAIKNSNFSHAYLFTGPRGVGKTTIARILAHEINGITYDNDDLKLDIIEIDAASNNRIDEIRDIREKLHIAPSELKYKIYIIDEVHMLTKQAFNALLKTLEEPPEHVIFILATTESHKIPDTIISRTQRFSFKPIEHSDTISHLRNIADSEKIIIEDAALKLLADHGRGSFRDSISMMDQISGIDSKNITAEQVAELLGVPDMAVIGQILETLRLGDVMAVFDLTQKLREKGINPSVVAKQLIMLLRDQLSNNTNVLSLSESVGLMKDLLPLTGNYGSFEALEITFLDSIKNEPIETIPAIKETRRKVNEEEIERQTNSENSNLSMHQPKKSPIEVAKEAVGQTEKSDDIIGEKNKKEEIINESEELVIIPPSTGNNWTDVLNTVKKNHNTLYGILRMAKIDDSDGNVNLIFRFEFHKKQIEQTKNLSRLHEIVDAIYGKKIKIITEFKKDDKPDPKITKPVEKTKQNNDLTSISNIFDGAELLES